MNTRASWIALGFLIALAACGNTSAAAGDDDDDGGVTCGTLVCDDAPAPTCIDSATLREFASACEGDRCSYPETDTACGAAGCCEDHCCAITPSNAETTGALVETGLVLAPPAGSTFDTSTDCAAGSILGDCSIVARADLPEACVCLSDELAIESLRVRGARALVLLAYRSVAVSAVLDVSAQLELDGPGVSAPWLTAETGRRAGHGGSFASVGGLGGGAAGALRPSYGGADLIPLLGGMPGQSSGGIGGGGGGALQITAGETIAITGSINAGGGGGQPGSFPSPTSGAGGGGSGGAVLLEAPAVAVAGKLAAGGGGGGGGGGGTGSGDSGTAGLDAAFAVARGGAPGNTFCVSGGRGGDGALGTAATAGVAPQSQTCGVGGPQFVGGGGGGGAHGRIRINTATATCDCGGAISPAASLGQLRVE
jgi:hypothetical protein